jgi:hypothetical protein
MVTTDDLIADWIGIRKTIKQQLAHLNDGHKVLVPGVDAGRATAEVKERLHSCLEDIESLLRSYSSRA